MNVEVVANPKTQGLAFKFFVVIALVVLFALFLYAILGPLPNQSKFLKQSGVANTLAVNGTSLLNGDVVIGGNTAMNGIMNVIGPARAQTSLSTPELDLITTENGIDTVQGTIKGLTSGTTQITGSSNVTVTDTSGTNTVVKFTGNTRQTDFYGDVVLNDLNGDTSLILKNQTSSNPSYELYNDPDSSDFTLISKTGTTVKNIIDATSNGNSITLLDASSTNPLVYVNGKKAGVPTLGRVYDTVYNVPPSINPTLGSLNVTGVSLLQGAVTASNALTVNGKLTSKLSESDMQGINFYGPTTPSLKGGRISLETGGDNLYVQGKESVNISAVSNLNFIASFDTRQGSDARSNRDSPAFDLKGYMKYTLPSYITTGISPFTYNSFTYKTTPTALSGTVGDKGWPQISSTTNIQNWNSTQTGANTYLVPNTSVYTGGWICPKRGIWQVTFDSGYNGFDTGLGTTPFSMGIGNIGNGTSKVEPYGLDKVSTFVVIDLGDIILPTLNYSSGLGTNINQATMTFSLIMELNPATST